MQPSLHCSIKECSVANRIKLKGTSERSFDIGLTNKQTFDANNLTANRTWVLPDSNGTAGYVLSTDGTGNLSWTAQTGGGGGNSQARIQFTAASSGTGQTFTDSNIGNFPNNTFANVFVNGVMLQTSEYSISSTTLTVSRYLTTGDNVIVAATSVGTAPAGSNTQVQYNNSGVFGASAAFAWDNVNEQLTVGKAIIGSGFGGTVITSNDVANPFYIIGADKTGTGGVAQSVDIYGGSGAGTNNTGGNVNIISGTKSGTGADGNIDINAQSGYVTVRNSVGAEIELGTTGFIDIVANGDLRFNGSVGSSGQVLTSNGSGNPSWSSNIKLIQYSETVVAGGNTGTSTITPDAAAGSIYTYTATGNFTFNSISNAVAGTSMTVIITQDGTGGKLLTSTMKFAGGSKTLSTAANAIDIISVFYDGTTYYASLTKGYA